MPRSPRLLVPNGYYHVFNRGIGRKRIRFLDNHAKIFYHQLSKTVMAHGVEILAYCLMENHYHLMVHTPKPNLDKAMQLFGSGFSQRVNREIGSDGALFKSRYRSVLVESDEYKVHLLRYIHLNPVEAGLVSYPGEYPFSSFNAYLEPGSAPDWLKTNRMMTDFSSLEAFSEFHDIGNLPELKTFYSKKRLSSSI